MNTDAVYPRPGHLSALAPGIERTS